MNFKRFGFFAAAALVFAGCVPQKQSAIDGISDYNAIFSTRPQTATHTVLMVKLSEEPLVASLKEENGKKVFDAAKVKALNEAQTRLIAELGDLSQDIKVIYRYRYIVNGLTLVAPIEFVERIRKIANVTQVEIPTALNRPVEPQSLATTVAEAANFRERNSVKFIGGDEAHAKGVRGQGMRVGIIDTGIDYTHSMFGGPGTAETYKNTNPDQASPLFPSAKVPGGIDLVGTKYDANSGNMMNRIPLPDVNPLDEGGHGTHVAGTVAGRGDNVNTYDGVAPDALLYGIKVFGKDGSTSDSVVIAALEYALDPNGDGDISDQLDVVNLSLGGAYGEPHILYTEAVRNLAKAGTFVVASGGNEGDNAFIVGAPSSSDDALSVAASTDDTDLNWKFRAVRFSTQAEQEIYAEAVEGTVGKSIKEVGDVTGPLVFLGLADKEFSEEVKAQVKGKVALIDRGLVTFQEKVERAFEAGAIGVVVINNTAEPPMAMGGGTGENNDQPFPIPAIMIEMALGTKIKEAMKQGEATLAFNTDRVIEKPELIDTITSFSSRGPRSIDGLLKPEITAPGANVVSAAMGQGDKGVPLSGTSMSGPHMAGVMALMKQTHPKLNSAQLKSMVMATSKTLVDKDKKIYSVSRQGAGRVQIMKALSAQVVSLPQAVSLGSVSVESRKTFLSKVTFTNISDAVVEASVVYDGPRALALQTSSSVRLEPGKDLTLDLQFTINAGNLAVGTSELGGWIYLKNGDAEIARVPVIALANKISQVGVDSVVVHSTSAADAQGAWVEAILKNAGLNAGDAYLFNYLGADDRKGDSTQDPFRSRACDLSESGYRVVEREGVRLLQVAVKLYEPLSTWDSCEVSVLIDGDGDGVADQELVGAKGDHLPPLPPTTGFASILLDAKAARQIRKQFELDTVAKGDTKVDAKDKPKEDYSSAVLSLDKMLAFENSTVAIIETPVEMLKLRPSGELAVRIAASYQESSAIEADDFLGSSKEWLSLNLQPQGAGYVGLPEVTSLKPGASQTVSITKGAGAESLWAVFPTNTPVVGGLGKDAQSALITPTYSESVR